MVPPTEPTQKGRAGADAYNAAVRILAGRDHSASELREKLLRRDFEGPEVEVAVERLTADGYVDDAKFAKAVARTHSHLGRRGLANQMKKKGLAEEHWHHLVDQISSNEEFNRALEAGRKNVKASDLQNKEPEVWKRRLAAYLQRRGFGFDTVRQVFEVFEEERRELLNGGEGSFGAKWDWR